MILQTSGAFSVSAANCSIIVVVIVASFHQLAPSPTPDKYQSPASVGAAIIQAEVEVNV